MTATGARVLLVAAAALCATAEREPSLSLVFDGVEAPRSCRTIETSTGAAAPECRAPGDEAGGLRLLAPGSPVR